MYGAGNSRLRIYIGVIDEHRTITLSEELGRLDPVIPPVFPLLPSTFHRISGITAHITVPFTPYNLVACAMHPAQYCSH